MVLCLLELARLGATCGLEAPSLIAMEKEIDNEDTSSVTSETPSDTPSDAPCEAPSDVPSEASVAETLPQAPAPVQKRKNSAPPDDLDREV